MEHLFIMLNCSSNWDADTFIQTRLFMYFIETHTRFSRIWIEYVHELGWKWDSCFVCFSHYVLEPKTFNKQFFFIERHFGISFQKEQRDYYMLWQASILCIKNLNTDTSKILYIDFIWFGGLAHMIKVKFNLNSTFLNVLA